MKKTTIFSVEGFGSDELVSFRFDYPTKWFNYSNFKLRVQQYRKYALMSTIKYGLTC